MANTRPHDSAEHLDSPEAIAAYLSEALETGDPSFVAHAIDIARDAGVPRENLYRALSGDTKPEFETIMKVLDALAVQLSA